MRIMSLEEAISIMDEYQAWRLGAETEQLNPNVITEAIDCVLNAVKNETS